MSSNSIICWHVYLAARIVGHQICFGARSHDVVGDDLSPAPGLELDTLDRQEEAESEFKRFVNRI